MTIEDYVYRSIKQQQISLLQATFFTPWLADDSKSSKDNNNNNP